MTHSYGAGIAGSHLPDALIGPEKASPLGAGHGEAQAIPRTM